MPSEVMQFDVHNFLTDLKYEAARRIDKHVIYLPPGFVMPRRRLSEQTQQEQGAADEWPEIEKLY